jgi:RNA polymerase sigma factor (sigma-70 family)
MGGSASGLDAFRLYLDEIGHEPPLSKDEEEALGRAIEQGRQALRELERSAALSADERSALEEAGAAGERARQRLIRANLRLVVSVARQWSRAGLPLLDLVQEGNLGLLRAVERFDHRRGFRFSTYATWWIRQAIGRAVANSGRLVRLPVHTGEALRRVVREQRRLEDDQSGRATPESVASRVGLRPEQVVALLRLAPEPVSISEPLGPGGRELGSVVADTTAMAPADLALASLLSAEVARLLDALETRDRQVMSLRFGLRGDAPLTVDAIAEVLGVSRESVRHSQARALRTLRRLALLSPETHELLAL